MARILIVDDDYQIRRIFRYALEKEGHEVTVAADGTEALAKLDQESFNLVTTDYEMPLMNGIELINEIKSRGWSVPVLMISAAEPPEKPQYFLEKPLPGKKLLGMVNAILNP